MREQIYFVKDNTTVPNTSIIRAQGYEAQEYIDNSQLLERIREIAELNKKENCNALFVIC